jgi:hypothetical protein
LKYCANPAERRFTIENAKKRVKAMSMKNLPHRVRETGTGFITNIGSGAGATKPNGDFSGSMSAWDNGPVTYRLQIFRGHTFEIYERLELATDGTALILTQKIVPPTGAEQVLTAKMPLNS